MTELEMVMQIKLILMFVGGFLLGFVGGYVYANSYWEDE